MKNILNRNITSLILIILLSGCNGDGDSSFKDIQLSEGLDSNGVLYHVQDKLIETPLNQNNTYIDLSDSMEASDGSAVALVGLVSLTQKAECRIVSSDTTGFTIETNSAKVCDYRFSVGSEQQAYRSMANSATRYSAEVNDFASATTRALVGNNTELLTPIHGQTQMDESVVIDLAYELAKVGIELDVINYTLDTVTLPAQVSTGSNVIFDGVSGTITYIPGGGFTGVERINYSYLNNDTASVSGGFIDVGVSVNLNSVPTAQRYEYPSLVQVNTVTLIDLSSVISDPDGDTLQLIDVFSYNSTNIIQPGATSKFDSNTFTFETNQYGIHELSYVVSDKKGGYVSSTIKIHVEADMSLIQSWDNITIFDPYINAPLTFTAPMSKAYADLVGEPYLGVSTGNGVTAPKGEEYVYLSYEQAYQHCINVGGRLPLEREMKTLYNTLGDVFKERNWPLGTSFMLAEKTAENEILRYDLRRDNSSINSLGLQPYMVSCVLLDSPAVKTFEVRNLTNVGRNGDGSYSITADVYGPDGNLSPYQPVKLAVDVDSYGAFDILELYSDAGGIVSGKYYDYSMQSNIITASIYNNIAYGLVSVNRADHLLEVWEPSVWNRLALVHYSNMSSSLRPHTSAGLPLIYSLVQNTNVYTKKTYIGSEFIGEIKIESPSNKLDLGKYSFYIQQVGDTPNSSWGPEFLQPGAPNTLKTYSISMDMSSNVVTVWDEGYFINGKELNIDLSGERTIWFESRDGLMSIYTAKGVDIQPKPKAPILSIPMNWAGIDPKQSYWVGMGSYLRNGVSQSQAIATEFLFYSMGK